MGRPIIGITSELDAARWGDWIREAAISPLSYTRAVERAGGAPVMVPPVPPASVAAYIESFDGLVFSGGRDIDQICRDRCQGDAVPDGGAGGSRSGLSGRCTTNTAISHTFYASGAPGSVARTRLAPALVV